MWNTLRYAAPAFLVPIVFVLTGPGEYLLGRGPVLGVLWASVAACAGIVALSFAAGGWVLGVGAAGLLPRLLAGAAALLLLFLDPATIVAGSVCLLTAVALATIDKRRRT
jgi:hypothetical protein